MQNTTDKKQTSGAAGEYYFMPPKNEMLIGSPQEDPRAAQAFSPAADAENAEYSANTTTQD